MISNTTGYIKTSEIPGLLLRERGIRFGHSSVRAWIARAPDAHPLIPTRPGRPGQAHEFDPADVLKWYREEQIRTLIRRIKARRARMRALGMPRPDGRPWD
jgi:hypothetical protein